MYMYFQANSLKHEQHYLLIHSVSIYTHYDKFIVYILVHVEDKASQI